MCCCLYDYHHTDVSKCEHARETAESKGWKENKEVRKKKTIQKLGQLEEQKCVISYFQLVIDSLAHRPDHKVRMLC